MKPRRILQIRQEHLSRVRERNEDRLVIEYYEGWVVDALDLIWEDEIKKAKRAVAKMEKLRIGTPKR